MPNPIYFQDGTVPFGASDVTCSNGQTYIVNSFTPDRPVSEVTDHTGVGVPSRSRVVMGHAGFSAELQLASVSQVYPKPGETLTYTVDANFGSETWVVHNAVADYSSDPGAIRVLKVTGKKLLSSVTVVTA